MERKLPGSSEIIRKSSHNDEEHFELYSSIVYGHVDGSKCGNLEMDIQIYEEKFQEMEDEIEGWRLTGDIMLKDKERLENIVER